MSALFKPPRHAHSARPPTPPPIQPPPAPSVAAPAEVPHSAPSPPSAKAPRFEEIAPLDARLLRALSDMGYESATPIQAMTIPAILAGHDVMGGAQTGTGKTAAFALPILQKLLAQENTSASPARHPPRALVLAPTRELADQVANSVKAYARHTLLKVAAIFGGVDMKPQEAALRSGVEFLVATPGRLLDHLQAKTCSLAQIRFVVLDEADRMLDIGFLPDLERILKFLPPQRQSLLFSATFSPEIKRLAQSYLQSPQLVEATKPNSTAAGVEQIAYRLEEDEKYGALKRLLREHDLGQALIFVNSRLLAARLSRHLQRDGLKAEALHGDKTQEERLKTLEGFKKGEIDWLVATDVAARGLDITGLPAVFNYETPNDPESYIHRIGRTGRAGAEGLAILFVTRNDGKYLEGIERLIKRRIDLRSWR